MRTIKQVMLISLVLILPFGHLFGQANPLARFNSLIGEWTGRGEGFGNDSSEINSVFRFVMGTTYIEVSNDSKFALSEKHPEGEHQTNKGYISYDNRRRVIVFRQFNNEGYVNIYLLNDSLSADSVFVFETKSIENFPPGGK
ncbi:MAG: hypothetical protein U9N85_07530, partial [Bacteroidota bacterium]|nr:hypothetical protein [Bacteroidota bacterium]